MVKIILKFEIVRNDAPKKLFYWYGARILLVFSASCIKNVALHWFKSKAQFIMISKYERFRRSLKEL